MAGINAVFALLKDTREHLERVAIQGFVDYELANLRQRASILAALTDSEVVKLDIASYSGEGPKRLALNGWL